MIGRRRQRRREQRLNNPRPQHWLWFGAATATLIGALALPSCWQTPGTQPSPSPQPQPQPSPSPIPSPPVTQLPPTIHELWTAHNRARMEAGFPTLQPHAELSAAAQSHAEWMAKTGRLSHTGAGGSSFVERAAASGYTIAGGGENIAAGYSSVDAVMRGWLASPGHRRNILHAKWRDAGFGVAKDERGRLWWATTFATGERAASATTSGVGVVEPGPLEASE